MIKGSFTSSVVGSKSSVVNIGITLSWGLLFCSSCRSGTIEVSPTGAIVGLTLIKFVVSMSMSFLGVRIQRI